MLKIFKTYNTETVARTFFNGYLLGNLFLCLIALYGFFSGAGTLATLCGFFYIFFNSLLSLNKRFRRSPFSILLCFYTFPFLNIPAAFILVMGSDYIYGSGVAIPFAQSDYQQFLPLSFLCLSLFWLAIWLAIVTVNIKKLNINKISFSKIKLMPILFIGVIVLVLTWIDNQNFLNIRMGSEGYKTSFLSFIFFDNAYLVIAGLLLFVKLNEPRRIADPDKINTLILLIFIGFTAIQFLGSSKAAILTRLLLLTLYPFCLFTNYFHSKVSFPTPKYLVILILLSLPLFYFALMQRIAAASGVAPQFSTLFLAFSLINENVIYDTFQQIFYRFSQGGLDRFLLVFQSFIINAFDPDTSRAFVNYVVENTLNLLLPGTPFPKSYAPSSQIFPQVISHNIIVQAIEFQGLIISLNTQAYTIFGVFIILFGIAAPVFLYLFIFIFVFVYSKVKSIFLKITILAFFSSGLSSYGIEVVIGNSAHLLVSILLMYFIIKILSRFTVMLPLKTNRPQTLRAAI